MGRGVVLDKVVFPTIMEKKKYLGLSPQDQEEYIVKKIKEILEINPNGITIPDIVENTPFTRPTIIKHVEKMISRRDAYKIKIRNFTIYYPNGQVVHPELTVKRESKGGTIFRATFLNNNFGKYLYIEDLNSDQVSGGSILIKRENLDDFSKLVSDIITNSDRAIE